MKKYRILKKNIKEKTEDCFRGYYKNHEIHIDKYREYDLVDHKETNLGWYIIVTCPDGCICYDGWWSEGRDANIDEAIEEALAGSLLIEK